MKGFFVTGTDTGVGKTFVTCALARKARAAGLRVFAFKPIETGVVGEWGEDQLALADASGSLPRGTFVLRMPAAPYVAARAEGIEIDMDRIAAKVRAGAESVDLVLVEGAGGWRVPITDSADMGELARLTKLPVLIVARALLGTINHTLMTIDAVRGDGLEIGGVVLSLRPGEDEAFARSNAEQIEEWSGIAPRIYPDISDLITDS